MKFLRVGESGSERPVVEHDGAHYDLRSLTADLDGEFWSSGGVDRVRRALDEHELTRTSIEGLRLGSPIARPGAVICVGQNYFAHAAETGHQPPAEPLIFLKTPNTVVGPEDDVIVPRGSTRLDWEIELGVVMARRASYLSSPEEALDYVAGFVISNDVSEREFQLVRSGGQWSKGKSAETFNPVGPCLVPWPDLRSIDNLAMRTWVNGSLRQDSSTSDMIFSVPYLIWHLSHFLVLEPGDLVNTGTPEGVALSGRFDYLVPGDRVELEIEGLGRQRQLIAGPR